VRLQAITLVLLLAVCGASCGDDQAETTPDRLCDPGTLTFCKCRGDRPGTRKCASSGSEFDACLADDLGDCEEIPVGGGGGSSEDSLFETCSEPEDCGGATNCRGGYCTKGCSHFTECEPPEGECVSLQGEPLCLPRCTSQQSCIDAFGPASKCSYSADVVPPSPDGFAGCADWTGAPMLPPDGHRCQTSGGPDDAKCHLGVAGAERICTDEAICGPGCHQDFDCTDGETCDAPSGTCSASCTCGDDFCDPACETEASCSADCAPAAVPGDKCPGILVPISIAAGTVFVDGDTSLAPTPSEAKGVGACAPSSTATEELVYQVLPDDSGSLLILLDPDPSFDAQLYVRSGSCTTGPQIACSDDLGLGLSEIVEVPTTAGEKVTFFVDGFDGSTGPYQLQLLLSAP